MPEKPATEKPKLPVTPKERFLANQQVAGRFAQMVSEGVFETACDFAMLQFVDNLPISNDMNSAMANQYRLEGAKLFKSGLQKLPFPPEPRTVDRSGMLDEPK